MHKSIEYFLSHMYAGQICVAVNTVFYTCVHQAVGASGNPFYAKYKAWPVRGLEFGTICVKTAARRMMYKSIEYVPFSHVGRPAYANKIWVVTNIIFYTFVHWASGASGSTYVAKYKV